MKMSSKIKINKGVAKAKITDLGAALSQIGEEIMLDSKTNYVPVVTGNLRRSGRVEKPVISTNRVTVTLGYGVDAPYARAVHERPDYMGQGKNKYLSKPLNAAVPLMPRKLQVILQQKVRERTRGTP
jgi:hypothetical protein